MEEIKKYIVMARTMDKGSYTDSPVMLMADENKAAEFCQGQNKAIIYSANGMLPRNFYFVLAIKEH